MPIEIPRGGVFPVKRSRVLAVLMFATLPFLTSSCGNSNKIASVTMTASGQTGTINLYGLGSTLQLQVLANYTSGNWVDQTTYATYTVLPSGVDANGNALPAPPLGVSIDNSGQITATANAAGNGICTWVSTTDQIATPGWAFTGYYQVTATYRGFTSNPVYIPVASAAGPAIMDGECGPQPSGN
jgi:hypothetical protein